MSIFSKSFINWIKNSNQIFILRGPFENKKVDFRNKLNNIGNNEFVDDEDDCADMVETYLKDPYKHAVVDIVGLDPALAKPYLDLAKRYFCMAICPTFSDNTVSDSVRSSPKVAKGDTEVNESPNTQLSVYFAGWFISDVDQRRLHKTGRRCLKDLWHITDIREQLVASIGTDDYKDFYPKQKKRLHVTAKFIGGCTDSSYVCEVSKDLCSMSEVTITGILLTPRTFSCHVVLPEADRPLFDDTGDFEMKPHVTLAVGGCNQAVQSGPDQVEVQRLIKEGVEPQATYRIGVGRVEDYGQCRFYVTLDEAHTLEALFNFVY